MPRERKQDRPPQVGRHPSNPGFLAFIGAMWIAAGIYSLAKLTAGWRLIPGIVFIGIGLLFFRGWAATILRRDNRRQK